MLVGTLTFSFALLRRVGNNFVPNLGVSIAGFLVVTSLPPRTCVSQPATGGSSGASSLRHVTTSVTAPRPPAPA